VIEDEESEFQRTSKTFMAKYDQFMRLESELNRDLSDGVKPNEKS
jgi:hypothetical protein